MFLNTEYHYISSTMGSLNFIAEKRSNFGKTSSSQYRKEDLVPAIIYGSSIKNINIIIPYNQIKLIFADYRIKTYAFSISVDNKSFDVVLRDVQFHPVTDRVMHIDFLNIEIASEVEVEVPVRLINKEGSIGVRRGGDIYVLQYNVKLNVKISKEPIEILIDADGSAIGQKFRLSDSILPENTSFKKDILLAKVVGGKKGPRSDEAEADSDEEKAKAKGG